MERPPRRTGVTDLSDDELLLFDFLFDKSAAAGFFRQDRYALHLGVGYSHGLDDQQLTGVLDDLCRRGLLLIDFGITGYAYELTAAGGELWELERRPIWDRYCDTGESSFTNQDGKSADVQILRILSPYLETCRDYVKLATEVGYESPYGSRSPVRYRIVEGDALFRWKDFPEVHACLVKIKCPASCREPSEFHKIQAQLRRMCLFWKRATFWRTLDELDSLHCKLDKI